MSNDKKLNKFEKTRLLAARALEIAKGASPKVDVKDEDKSATLSKDYVGVAEKELEEGKIDLYAYKSKK